MFKWDYRSAWPMAHPLSFVFQHQRWTCHCTGCVTAQCLGCSSSFMSCSLPLTRLFLWSPPPPPSATVRYDNTSLRWGRGRALHRKPKSGLLRTSKDMRVNKCNEPAAPQLFIKWWTDTRQNEMSVLIAMTIMDAENRLMYLKTKERNFGKY